MGAANAVPGSVKRVRNSDDCCACGNDVAAVEHADVGGAYALKSVGDVGHPVDNTDVHSPKFVCDYKRGDNRVSFSPRPKTQLNEVSKFGTHHQ